MVGTVLAALNLLIKVLLRDAPERECSRQQYVEEHSECPHIYRLAVILMLTHDLRAHVARRPTEDLEALVVGDHDREAEIDELHHSGPLLLTETIRL